MDSRVAALNLTESARANPHGGKERLDILGLSSSLLTDRMLLYTRFLNVLSSDASVMVWATSTQSPQFQEMWSAAPAAIQTFPKVYPFKEFPYNYLRRLNELVWDYRLRPPSPM